MEILRIYHSTQMPQVVTIDVILVLAPTYVTTFVAEAFFASFPKGSETGMTSLSLICGNRKNLTNLVPLLLYLTVSLQIRTTC